VTTGIIRRVLIINHRGRIMLKVTPKRGDELMTKKTYQWNPPDISANRHTRALAAQAVAPE